LPCPLYKDGVCLSPKRHALAPPEQGMPCMRSQHEYAGCPYYDSSIASSIERLLAISAKRLGIVPSIHLFNKPIKSLCERYAIIPEQGGYVAYCAVLGRYLTIYEAETCEKHYQTCPLRKLWSKG